MAIFKIMKTKWIDVMIIVMALGLLSLCFAAWDNDRPSDSDSVYTWDNLIRANNTALEVELGIDLNEAHPYYQSAAPTTKPDTSTALDVDDNGRLWIDSDDNIVYILTDYSGITWTKINPVLANDTYFTSVDNAGTGTVDLIKANTSDVAVLPDGSEMASSGAPTADADIANKKYVDDQITTAKAAVGWIHDGSTAVNLTTLTGTFQDVNTGIGGRGIVFLKVESTQNACVIFIKTKGESDTESSNSAEALGCSGGKINNGQFFYAWCETDTSGYVQAKKVGGTDSHVTVTVMGYLLTP